MSNVRGPYAKNADSYCHLVVISVRVFKLTGQKRDYFSLF